MILITENFVFNAVAILSTLICIIGFIAAFKWNLGYWKRIGVPTLNPSVPFGDSKDFITGRITMGEQFRQFYKAFKSKGHKHGGVFIGPKAFYLPTDPEIIKNIMQKDFDHFMNHAAYCNERDDPLSGHIFNLEDAKWRSLRVKLTPAFTSGKMKMMFKTLMNCTMSLKDIIDSSANNHAPVNIKEILACFTTDIIGSTAFGLECNSLKDPNTEFRKYGKKAFEIPIIDWRRLLFFWVPHSILRAVRYKATKKDVESFFMNLVRDTVNYREKNHIYRKDFMHLLLQLKNCGSVTDDEKITDENRNNIEQGLTMNELTAQAFVFFLAGFETSSTTMTFALYELATHPEIQEKIREEINTVLEKHNNKMSYEAVTEMTYMDKILYETLRLYPALPLLTRKCSKEYKIPNINVTLEKDVIVIIPVLGLHSDPKYYPDPEKFDPERFNEKIKNSRPGFTWLPFGEGPRICIGMRFGLMQSKIGLITLLKNYKISLNKKTTKPLKVSKKTFIMNADGGVWLDVEKLN